MSSHITPADVLQFWFRESSPHQWFREDPAFDDVIRERFGACVEGAVAGDEQFQHWTQSSDGCLALILVLDQFTRNIFRGDARAYDGDARACAVSRKCVEQRHLEGRTRDECMFLLMPLLHCEEVAVHHQTLPLWEKYTDPEQMQYVKQYLGILERFGRFPHRNAALGRESTPVELEFLQAGGSG